MIVLFPMGGTGERFRAAGYETPKPLINIGGRTLLEHVLACYPDRIAPQTSYIFITQRNLVDHIKEIVHRFRALHLRSEFYFITDKTAGPVDTILSISPLRALLDNRRELLVCDCDSLIATTELEDALRVWRSQGAIGGVLLRKTNDPACSYAEIDERNRVLQTAEKKVISNWSTTGPYWWREARDFLNAALIKSSEKEYHISPCYNYLIKQKRMVLGFKTLTFRHLGTPALLESYAEDMSMKVIC